MIKTLLLLITLISLSAEAKKPKKHKQIKKPPLYTAEYVTEQRMESIDLQGLQIVGVDGLNEFRYQIKPVDKISRETENLIFKYSNDKVVSRIYELNQKAAFQNIYLYIAKAEDFPGASYVLNIIYLSSMYGSTSSFCSRYYITKGNDHGLMMYRYKKDSPRIAKSVRGLFPDSVNR